jgi:F-type H+-transporting ATPase subunit b
MPQISQISEIFASQLFWLIVTFGLIYLTIGHGMVPKIEGTVEKRDRKIAEDLAAAEAAREAADALDADYRGRLEASRAEALKVTQGAKQASARETEQRIKAADAEIDAKVDAAEAEIAAAARGALAEIEAVAAVATREMVVRLSGAEISRERAAAAVREAIARG